MRPAQATAALSALLCVLGHGPAQALEITAISPEPLISGAMAQLAGGPCYEEDLAVRLDGADQALQLVQSDLVLFHVSTDVPLGPAVLEVETGGELLEIDVEISAPPPSIGSVSPQPAVMGQHATVLGSELAAVVSVSLNDVLCEVTAQTDFQLAFLVPYSPEVVGSATLRLETASWSAETDIQVKAPAPSIDALIPNPIRQGDLLTIQGTIIPSNLAVSVGDKNAQIFSSAVGEVVVQVPEGLSTGPVDVLVHLGDISSESAGPLHVQSASSERPSIERVAPSNLTSGGSIWLFGDEMEDVDWASEGLWVGDCDDKACRVTPDEPELGQLLGAIGSPEGTDIFTVTVLADVLVVPELLSAEPQPAYRGQELTLHGSNLHQVNAVYVGGLEQAIDYVDVDVLRLTLDPATPMGAERAMVAGGSASNALTIVVLQPLPGTGDDGEDITEDAGDTAHSADPGPVSDTPPDADALGGDVPTGSGGGSSSGGGCGGAPSPANLFYVLAGLALLLRRRV
jgi:hypothetical protein